MIATLLLLALVVWIIKDHRAVMRELKATRDSALLSENHSQV